MSSTVIPTLRYQDARRAVAFLQEAFGFIAHMVVEGEGDLIEHAQMTHGTGMVMLGSEREGAYGDLVSSDGRPSGGAYVVIAGDVDEHMQRARDAGADIAIEPSDESYGGRDYTCTDFEGNVWTFGTYDPWSGA